MARPVPGVQIVERGRKIREEKKRGETRGKAGGNPSPNSPPSFPPPRFPGVKFNSLPNDRRAPERLEQATVWHKVFAGSNFCDFSSDPQK